MSTDIMNSFDMFHEFEFSDTNKDLDQLYLLMYDLCYYAGYKWLEHTFVTRLDGSYIISKVPPVDTMSKTIRISDLANKSTIKQLFFDNCKDIIQKVTGSESPFATPNWINQLLTTINITQSHKSLFVQIIEAYGSKLDAATIGISDYFETALKTESLLGFKETVEKYKADMSGSLHITPFMEDRFNYFRAMKHYIHAAFDVADTIIGD